MSERTRYLLRFGVVMALVAGVGMARWAAVGSMQQRVNDTVRRVFAREIGSKLSTPVGERPRTPADVIGDSREVVAAKTVAAVVARTWTAISMIVLFLACLWVAHSSGHFVLTLLMGVWGWFVAAAVNAAVVSLNVALYVDLRDAVTSPTLAYPGSHVPFALLFVTALVTALPVYALLPWVSGWGIGWGIRAWRTARPPFGVAGDGAPVSTVQVPPQRCSCGMLNVGTATVCYACGLALKSGADAE